MINEYILFSKRIFGVFSVILSSLLALGEGMNFARCYIENDIYAGNAGVLALIVVWLLCGLFYTINNHNKVSYPIAWSLSFIYAIAFIFAIKYADDRLGILNYSSYVGGVLTILSLLIFVPDDSRFAEKEIMNCSVIDGCVGGISIIIGCIIMFQSGEYWTLVLGNSVSSTVAWSSLVMALVWIFTGCVLVGVKDNYLLKPKYILSSVLYLFSGIFVLLRGDLHKFAMLKYYIALALIMCIISISKFVSSDKRKYLK